MPDVTDPRVVYAIRKRYEQRARRRNRARVLAALEQVRDMTLEELRGKANLETHACGIAIDELRVAGAVVEVDVGLYAAVKRREDENGREGEK